MKLSPILLTLALLWGHATVAFSQAFNYVFPVDMTVQTSPQPSVTFTWTQNIGTGKPMHIERRLFGLSGNNTWTSVAQITGTTKTYTDTGVTVGNTYEYRLYCVELAIRKPFMVTAVASLNSPLEDERGGIILVVDNVTRAKMPLEVQQLEMDLVGDGYFVKRVDTDPAGVGSPVALKAAIKSVYEAHPGINSLLLFGNVPYVRSGLFAPDGHSPTRAHETDTYYADMTGTWTDTELNKPSSGSAENENIPGDGKFDQSIYPPGLKLATGRVYFENIEAFRKRPLDYLRDYLHKDHAWRHAWREVNYKALTGNREEQYPWYNFCNPIFGTSNVQSGYFSALETESRIFGVGLDVISPVRPTQAIFMTNFKSYKQHWLRTNNAIVSTLAQPDWGLTCTWGARPSVYLHSMAAGKPIGYGFLRSQNDLTASIANFDYYRVGNVSFDEFPAPWVSLNLMGDPTLRLHPVPGPAQLNATRTGTTTQLAWTAADVPVVGYHVYRSTTRLGPYVRLTTAPVTGLSLTDSAAPAGEAYYQVRSVVLMNLPNTGNYYNQSQGTFTRITAAGAVNRPPVASPASTVLNVKSNTPFWLELSGSDPDGDPMAPIILKNPTSGQIRWRDGQPFYISAKDFVGTETILYVMSDGIAVSEPAEITLNVDSTGTSLVGFSIPEGSVASVADTWHSTAVQPSAVTVVGYTASSPYPSRDQLAFGPIAPALEANKYLEWSVTPVPGYHVSLDRATLALCGNEGDVINYELRVSTDNFVTWTVVPPQFGTTTGIGLKLRNAGQLETFDLAAVPALQNVTVPVKFHLHFWNPGFSVPKGVIYLGKLTEANNFPNGIEHLAVTGRALINQAPLVTAALRDPIEPGANSGVLVGTVFDDGLPASPGVVTTSWIQIAGPGVATFSDPAALETAVSFNASGTYLLRLTASDGDVSASADLSIQITLDNAVATRVAITPAEITVLPATTQSFAAVLYDQYDRPISPQPIFAWSLSGGGTITSAGLVTAGPTEGGPHTVTATAASKNGSAQITIFNQPPSIGPVANQILALGGSLPPIAFIIDDAETPASALNVTATSSNLTLLPSSGVVPGGSGANRTLSLTPAINQTGVSTISLHVGDGHKSTTRTFTLSVNARVATSVVVSPETFSLPPLQTGAFTAIVLDQFGDPVSPQPTLTWSVSGGGSINSAGLFTAGASHGGPHTVTASVGALHGTAAVTVRAAGAFAWTGAVSSDWHQPANWNGFVPGPSDWALFDAATVAHAPVITDTARVLGIRVLSTSGPVEISGGTLQLGAGGVLNGGQIRGNATINSTSVTACDPLLTTQIAALLALNQPVSISGFRIPANTTVIAASGTTLTLSQAVTGSSISTFSLDAASSSPITIASAVVLTTGQPWQLSHNGSTGSVLTVSGPLSGSGELRIGGTNNSNGTTLPWLRLTGANSAYTGTISFSNPVTQGSGGLLLGSAAAMTGGLIHLESPSGQSYNLWLTGGPDSGTYTFGVNGTQATGARVQTRSGYGGLFTTGGTVAWNPGAAGDYAWSATGDITYLTVAGTDSATPVPLELGHPDAAFIISGANKTFATSGAGNHRGLVTLRSALADGNEATARTLTTHLPLLRLTRPAVNQHATARLNLTVTGGTVVISDVAQLPGGNLNLNGGTLLLDGVTWEEFAAARNATPASGNARWQGTPRFAAGGDTPLTLAPTLLDVATFGFGSSARSADGSSALARAPVRVAGDIAYADANRTLEVTGALSRQAATGTYSGFDATPFHELAGTIGGLGATKLLVVQGTNNAGSAEGESGGVLRLSGANTFAGTVLLGTNSLTADTGNPQGFGALIARSDAAFGHAANEVVVASGGRGWALLLEDASGTGETFSRAFRYDLRGNSSARSWAFGAYAGLVTYTGTLTVQPQSGQIIANNTTHNLNLHAESGATFLLGGSGAPATFHNNANAAATANVTTLLYRKTGPGVAVLRNVAFTSANANTRHAFAITDGTLRETGTSATDSLNGVRLALGGGVLETSGEFTRDLGTAPGQLQWSSGGFSARGGELRVNLNATAANTEWQDTNFLINGGPLVFGSATADAAVVLENPLALANADNLTVTREIRVNDNPATPADRAVLLGNLRNRGDGGDGGTGARNLVKTGDGLLELAATGNELRGSIAVAEGTLLVSGNLTAVDLAVASGATLAGTGTINATVTVAAGGSLAFHLATPPAEHPPLTLVDRLVLAPGAKLLLSTDLAPGVATYTLARADGGITGPLPALIKPSGLTAYLQVSGTNLQLVVGNPPQPTTALELWQLAHFTPEQLTNSALEATVWGHTADPDRDGLNNLLEYAFDLNPLVASGTGIPSLELNTARTHLAFSFHRARSELTYEVLASDTLAPDSWTVIATNPGTIGQNVTVTDTVPVSTHPRRFLRLRVTP